MKDLLTHKADILNSVTNNLQNPFACDLSDLSNFVDVVRYVAIDSVKNYSLIAIDTQSLEINTRNKIIKVWVIQFFSESGRKIAIDKMSTFGIDLSSCGYIKSLFAIEYKNMKKKLLLSSIYNCDGTAILTTQMPKKTAYRKIDSDPPKEKIIKFLITNYDLK